MLCGLRASMVPAGHARGVRAYAGGFRGSTQHLRVARMISAPTKEVAMAIKSGPLDHEQVWAHYADGQPAGADRPIDGPSA